MIEAIDEAIPLECFIEVKDESIDIDFQGTGGCVNRGINVPFCYTNAMSLYSIKCITIPSLPNNEGASRPISVSAPEGCLLNAQPPYPTGGRHAIGHFVPGLIFGALVLKIWSADTNILKGLLGLGWTALLLIGIFFAEKNEKN